MHELERAAMSGSELAALVEGWGIQLSTRELSAFLTAGSVRLSACAHHIAYLSPEPTSAPRSQTREREGSRAA
jgi:hypothetical protein